MHLNDAQHIYFAGIGGIGMSALAKLLLAEEKRITGSDIAQSEVTASLQRKGIHIEFAQSGGAVTDRHDLLIYSDALPEDHPERQAAEQLNIPTLSYFQAVGQYMQGFEHAIAISGTHGKSTTTAMISSILVEAGLDPTVIVGSIVKEFGSNARFGGKEYIVVEACEHKAHMLNLHPNIIVLTNIEEDHLDHYIDLEHIVATFQKYINHLPQTGLLIKNMDDSESAELDSDCHLTSYGIEHKADITAQDIVTSKSGQTFTVGQAKFTIKKPGRFNVYNALAAIAIARELGVTDEIMAKALKRFKGIWRRFEVMGEYQGATVISDYAHHPTAVRSTINATKEFYPGRRVMVVFQPHQRSRTQKLFDKFVDSLHGADFAIVQEIYDVAGREAEGGQISSRQLVAAVEEAGRYAVYTADVAATRQEIDEMLEPDDVLLIMGAGDIYKLAEELTK